MLMLWAKNDRLNAENALIFWLLRPFAYGSLPIFFSFQYSIHSHPWYP